ncbi:hypothetical protein OK016_16770 [Vibrio chagasii]|nr:hypothetical protein [Vibrio chagasii]
MVFDSDCASEYQETRKIS